MLVPIPGKLGGGGTSMPKVNNIVFGSSTEYSMQLTVNFDGERQYNVNNIIFTDPGMPQLSDYGAIKFLIWSVSIIDENDNKIGLSGYGYKNEIQNNDSDSVRILYDDGVMDDEVLTYTVKYENGSLEIMFDEPPGHTFYGTKQIYGYFGWVI